MIEKWKSVATIQLPETGAIPRHIPRGIEVLIKKAAVDPAFKDILFEKRAGAAAAIGLGLTAAEEAMLAAIPLAQLEGIVAHTRVDPKFNPAFLGYAAGAMLAALGTTILVWTTGGKEPTKTKETPEATKGDAGRFKIPFPTNNKVPAGYGSEGYGSFGMRPSELKETAVNTPRRRVRRGVSAGARAYEIDRPPRSVDAVVRKHLVGIENAYNSALKENPNLGTGRITVKFTVTREGDVTSAEVAEDTLGAPSLCADIITRVKSWRFPPFGGGNVTVLYPFVFIAEEGSYGNR